MKYIDSYKKEDFSSVKAEDKYGRSGSFLVEDKDKIFAKCVYINEDGIKYKYYVLTYHNTIYDPFGPDSHRERTLDTILKNTSKETFESYISYLKTRNRLYLTRANRSYIDA
jgi:hypothetical protein